MSKSAHFNASMKVFALPFSSGLFNEHTSYFTCKVTKDETQSCKQFRTNNTQIQLLEPIKETQKCFILIKRFYIDKTSTFESQDTTAFVKNLRKKLCTAFSNVIVQIQACKQQLLAKSKPDADTTNLLSSLIKEIKCLLKVVGNIGDISNIQSLKNFDDLSPRGGIYYQYVHTIFDIWYNCITILQILNTIPFGMSKHETFSLTVKLDPFLEVTTSFLKDFACLAVNYYHLFRNSAPFPCQCFEELWIMIIHIIDKEPSTEDRSFWFVYCRIVQELLNPSSKGSSGIIDKIEIKDLTESCLWLTALISKLYKYDIYGKYCESITPKSGYCVLKFLINKLISLYPEGKIENIRFSIFHTLQIISLWEPTCDIILPLTDFFIRNIAETFLSHGAEINGLSYLFKNSSLWFQFISKLSSPCTSLNMETSFDLYLHILTKQLSKDSIHHSLWRLLKGRIYSKITAKKMKEFSEVGLQNSFSLFLAIAESGQIEATDKICELARVVESTLSPRKQTIAWKALFVLLHIHQKNGDDFNKVISEVTRLFNETCSAYSAITRDSMHKNNVMTLLLVYIDCMGDVFEQCPNLSLFEYKLIGSGFTSLLPSCGISELNYILNVFKTILSNVIRIADDISNMENYTLQSQYSTFINFMFTHIYPFIESASISNTPPDSVADIAVLLMRLSYKFSNVSDEKRCNYCDIFSHFTMRENINILLICRFVSQLLDDAHLVGCIKTKKQPAAIIFQVWLKCIINLPPPCHQVEELTPKVLLQKNLVEMFPKVLDLNVRSHDYCFTSIAFFRVMGETYDSITDLHQRKQLKEKTFCYFQSYIPYVLKKICAQRDAATFNYLYKHITHLVEHCSELMYLKGNAESVLPNIIDKTVIPHLIFPKDKSSQQILICSIKEYLPCIIRGLFKLDYKHDLCIQREIKDVLVNYACCYSPHTNPITRLIIETVNGRPEGLKPETFDFLLDIMRVNILLNSSINVVNAYTMLYDTLKFTPQGKQFAIITTLMKSVLEMYMKQGNNLGFYQDMIKKILKFLQEKKDFSISVLVPILKWFVKEKLQWATAKAFSVLDIFVEFLPHVFQHVVSFLIETIKTLEANRGSGPDYIIRENLKRTLSKLSKSNNLETNKFLSEFQ